MSDSFQKCSEIESISRNILSRYLESLSSDGIIRWNKWEPYQQSGDLYVLRPNNIKHWIELKAEEKTTGNLFLEMFSNLPILRVGWLLSCKAETLIYHFLDTDMVYEMKMSDLIRFLTSHKTGEKPKIFKYWTVIQSKHIQRNETWGLLAPIEDIKSGVDVKSFRAGEFNDYGKYNVIKEQLDLTWKTI